MNKEPDKEPRKVPWWERLEEKLTQKLGGKQRRRRIFLLTAVGGVGIGLIAVSTFLQRNQERPIEDPPSSSFPASAERLPDPMAAYERQYEQTLQRALEQVAGIHDVHIMVNLDSTVEDIVQVDVRDAEQVTTEADQRGGGNRSISQHHKDKKTAYARTKDGEQPVVIKRVKPKVRGVLVVARGVERLLLKATVIEAVQRALEVPPHRIAVLPKDP